MTLDDENRRPPIHSVYSRTYLLPIKYITDVGCRPGYFIYRLPNQNNPADVWTR